MTARVFIGGSRRLSRLNSQILAKLDSIAEKEHEVLIGDANGADKAVQRHFAARGYRHVIVYCVNKKCRNNVGRWPTKNIQKNTAKRDFEYYAAKDREMAAEASCGLMLWEGTSQGTLRNIHDLVGQHKIVLVFLSTTCEFYTLRTLDDITSLLRVAGWDQRPQGKEASETRRAARPIQLDLGLT